MDSITITRHETPDAGEYRAKIAGSEDIGLLTWVRHGGARIVEHTLVPPTIGGRGVAAKLVEALVGDARAEGFRIVPACSYVAVAFRRHPEWSDLLAR